MGFQLIRQRGAVAAPHTWTTVNMQAELRDPTREVTHSNRITGMRASGMERFVERFAG